MIGSNTTLSASNPGESIPVRQTCYYYDVKTAVTSTISEKFSNMLFDNTNTQWLASNSVMLGYQVFWGINGLGLKKDGNVGMSLMYGSWEGNAGYSRLVRPVVTLKSDVNLKWNGSANEWQIQ